MQVDDNENPKAAAAAVSDYELRTSRERTTRRRIVWVAGAALGATAVAALTAASNTTSGATPEVIATALASLGGAFAGMAVSLRARFRAERERATPAHVAQRLALQEYGLSLLHHQDIASSDVDGRVVDLMEALERSVADAKAARRRREAEGGGSWQA